MPFDRISVHQLFVMRILTSLMFLALAAGIVGTAATSLLDPQGTVSRLEGPLVVLFGFAALNFGMLLGNAGLMLLELVTKPPLKVAINVPFVAGNFQTALAVGLVSTAFAVRHATLAGSASSEVLAMQWLCLAGWAMNLFFVVMTKLHWNFTENTGRSLPTG